MLRPILSALLLSAAPLAAQITLDADDLVLPQGASFTMESVVIAGPLGSSGVVLGPAGADRVFDFRDPLQGALRLEMDIAIVPLSQAPEPDAYPEASYAALYEIRDGQGTVQEMVAYMAHDEAGDRLLAIVGGDDTPVIPQQTSSAALPMAYGKRWSDPATIDTESAEGVRTLGSLDQAAEVDGWGTVVVPAGQFPYLRIHTTGSGTFRYEGNPDVEALGEVRTESEGWTWNTRRLGTVVSVVELTTSMQGSSATMTQVTRLLAVDGVPSAVVALGWGTLKLLHAQGMRAPGAAETGR